MTARMIFTIILEIATPYTPKFGIRKMSAMADKTVLTAKKI